jgi:methylmalonyl-CoA/ethylmalonyl-CoA epimerase
MKTPGITKTAIMPRRLEHIGIVVKDLSDAVRTYTEILGLKLEKIEYLKEHKVRIALLPIGETLIELIEDQDPHGDYSTFLIEKGQGVHHICFQVDNISQTLAELKKTSVNLHQEEPVMGHNSSRIAFFDFGNEDDLVIELCERPEE